MTKPRRPRWLLILALALAAGSASTHEDGHRGDPRDGRDWEDGGHSYDQARRAAERGEILSLEAIYARTAARFPGRVLEAELEWEDRPGGHQDDQRDGNGHGRGDRHWVYELKVLEPDGRLRKVHLDAHSGAILDDEEDDD